MNPCYACKWAELKSIEEFYLDEISSCMELELFCNVQEKFCRLLNNKNDCKFFIEDDVDEAD